MAINLFCYTSLDPDGASAALKAIRAAGAFDYEADFIPSAPMVAGKDAHDMAREFTALTPKTLFLVRLNNKSLLGRQTVMELVEELKSGFPDLLILWENERAL